MVILIYANCCHLVNTFFGNIRNNLNLSIFKNKINVMKDQGKKLKHRLRDMIKEHPDHQMQLMADEFDVAPGTNSMHLAGRYLSNNKAANLPSAAL
jgi:regulator of replication initiation timing